MSRRVLLGFLCLCLALAESAPAAQPSGPARTDRFGDPLPEEAVSRLGTARLRLDEVMLGGLLGFSGDGKTLVWHSRTGAFTWDVATGHPLHRFLKGSKENGFISTGSLSPDGKQLALPSPEGVRLWDVATAKLVRTVGSGVTRQVRYSPDGKTLAVCVPSDAKEGLIEFWEVAGGRKVGSLRWKEFLSPIRFTGDGKKLLTMSRFQTAHVWDVATGALERQIKFGVGAWTAAASPDGKRLALVAYNGNPTSPSYDDLRIWDVAAGKEIRPLVLAGNGKTRKRSMVLANLTFLDDKTLLTAGIDDTLIIWDAITGKELRRFSDEIVNPSALALSPDGKTVAIATGAATVRLIDLKSGKDRLPFAGPHPLAIQAAVFTPDGRTVATAGGKTIFLWDPQTGAQRGRLDGHGGYVSAIRLLPDGRTLLSSASDNTLRFWDLKTAKEVRRLDLDPNAAGPSRLLVLSRDGKRLAVGGLGGAVVVLNADTGREPARLPGHDKTAYGAAFGPDGRTLVTWDNQNRVRVWDLATNRVRTEFSFPEEGGRLRIDDALDGCFTDPVAVAPDGHTIVYGSGREGNRQFETIRQIDLSTGREIRWLAKHPNSIAAVAFSPDGRTLAVGHVGAPTIHLVELVTGLERHRLEGANTPPSTLAFSADSKTLVSGHVDTTALVWDLTGRLSAKTAWGQALPPAELDALWADLAVLDAEKAYRAMRRLAASPGQAVSHLGSRLRPVPPADEKRLGLLIADLDSDQFAVRDKAAKQLEGLGESAVSAFQRTLKGDLSFEVRRRLETLLDKQLRQRQFPSPERLQALRALEVLEAIGTPEVNRVLKILAGGTPAATMTQEAGAALGRLAKSPLPRR